MLTSRHLLSVTGSRRNHARPRPGAPGAQRCADRCTLRAGRFSAAPWMDSTPCRLMAIPTTRPRVNLALSDDGGTDGVLDLDGKFGLHPEAHRVEGLVTKGELTACMRWPTPYRERSLSTARICWRTARSAACQRSGCSTARSTLMGGSKDRRLGLALGPEVPLACAQDRVALLGAGQPAGGRTRFPEPRAGDVCEAADARRHLAPGEFSADAMADQAMGTNAAMTPLRPGNAAAGVLADAGASCSRSQRPRASRSWSCRAGTRTPTKASARTAAWRRLCSR